jgi:hypothetical protein
MHALCNIFLSPMFPRVLFVTFLLAATAFAEDSALVEKPLRDIRDHDVSSLGTSALSIRSADWKHGETQNFVIHFHDLPAAQAVASECEFYYRLIAGELERDTTHWERKGHIFIFEHDEDWRDFQGAGGLEPWTGGIHHQGELFVPRDEKRKFKGNALAHELTHLVVFRFFGAGVPLWLNEGLAEYTATRWYASYWRARGYRAHPVSMATAPADYLPIPKLTSLLGYPGEVREVTAFYSEAERLVRFLSAIDKHRFSEFLQAMSQGARFESALDKSFGSRFFNLEALEKEFKPYAGKDYVEAP